MKFFTLLNSAFKSQTLSRFTVLQHLTQLITCSLELSTLDFLTIILSCLIDWHFLESSAGFFSSSQLLNFGVLQLSILYLSSVFVHSLSHWIQYNGCICHVIDTLIYVYNLDISRFINPSVYLVSPFECLIDISQWTWPNSTESKLFS